MRRRPARKLPAVYPRKSDAMGYSAAIGGLVEDLHETVKSRINHGVNKISHWYDSVNTSIAEVLANPNYGAPQANFYMSKIKDYHRARFYNNVVKTLGVNVASIMHEATINQALAQRIAQNVGLIRSIPQDMQPQLQDVIAQTFEQNGFDSQALFKAIQGRFNVAKSRAKLIANDQNNKAISQFTQIRSQQIGINKYDWETAEDDRVRPTHAENDGKIFSYDNPPPETGNPGDDVNCRCVALGVIPD